MGIGREGRRALRHPLDFEIGNFPIKMLANKVVFLVSYSKNEISPFSSPRKILGFYWKNLLLPLPGKKASDAHAHRAIHRY